MVEIKSGYNDKPTTIEIQAQENGNIELWIEETGYEGKKETLSYMTADELLKLLQEVQSCARDLFRY
jgi:hypothetical protein